MGWPSGVPPMMIASPHRFLFVKQQGLNLYGIINDSGAVIGLTFSSHPLRESGRLSEIDVLGWVCPSHAPVSLWAPSAWRWTFSNLIAR